MKTLATITTKTTQYVDVFPVRLVLAILLKSPKNGTTADDTLPKGISIADGQHCDQLSIRLEIDKNLF